MARRTRRSSSARWRRIAGAAWLAVLLPTNAPAQGLTVERIWGSDDFTARTYPVTWMPDAPAFARLTPDERGVDEVWRVDAVSGDSVKLISAADLQPPDRAEPLSVESITFSADGERVLIFADAEQVWRSRTRGAYYVFDLPTRRLVPVGPTPGRQMFAKFSPDGERVAFVREGDLFVFDLTSGIERPLTRDGGDLVVNGTSDWLYEEELGLRDAFRWSPDGTRIAYWQFDQGPVGVFDLYDPSTVYPTERGIRYPKAGTSNSRVRIGVLDVATARTTWFDVEGGDEAYLPWMEWAHSSDEVFIQRLNRRQNELELRAGSAVDGTTRLLFSETSDTWVDGGRDVWWRAGGGEFLWVSDRGGYRHLYVYGRDGRLLRQLTRGRWDVTSVSGVDTVAAVVYFSASAESPMTRAVMSADLDADGDARILVGGRGMRSASFSTDFSLFLETASTIATPPVVTLRDRSGALLRTVENNAGLAARIAALDLREPEFIDVTAADGTRLNAWIMKPRTFDPTRAYPLLLYAYGGPGSQTVTDGWAGAQYLWHQLLVGRGVLVASVDNRGTGGRGRAFTHQVYLRLGQVEAADQLAAARELGAEPWVDEAHVGIWGWSYGGYLALMTALASDGAIRAAVAVAPVTDWKYYDTAYTERYMRTPAENPDGYREGSAVERAGRLESDLLIVHGTADDNVHPQNTTALVDALVAAGRPFDMALYPYRTHSIAGGGTRVHLFDRLTTYLVDRLSPTPTPSAPSLPARLGGLF